MKLPDWFLYHFRMSCIILMTVACDFVLSTMSNKSKTLENTFMHSRKPQSGQNAFIMQYIKIRRSLEGQNRRPWKISSWKSECTTEDNSVWGHLLKQPPLPYGLIIPHGFYQALWPSRNVNKNCIPRLLLVVSSLNFREVVVYVVLSSLSFDLIWSYLGISFRE